MFPSFAAAITVPLISRHFLSTAVIAFPLVFRYIVLRFSQPVTFFPAIIHRTRLSVSTISRHFWQSLKAEGGEGGEGGEFERDVRSLGSG